MLRITNEENFDIYKLERELIRDFQKIASFTTFVYSLRLIIKKKKKKNSDVSINTNTNIENFL